MYDIPASLPTSKSTMETGRNASTRERLILGGHAATCREEARNPGYHSRNVASQSPFNTRVRICSRRCAPRGVQAICCFLQKRLLNSRSIPQSLC
jgi:hypothetical protein